MPSWLCSSSWDRQWVPCPDWPHGSSWGSRCGPTSAWLWPWEGLLCSSSSHRLCSVSLRRSRGLSAGHQPFSTPRKRCHRCSYSAENNTVPTLRGLTCRTALTPPKPLLEAAAEATWPSRSAASINCLPPSQVAHLPSATFKSKIPGFLVSKVFITKNYDEKSGGNSCSPRSCSMSPVVRSRAVNMVASIT